MKIAKHVYSQRKTEKDVSQLFAKQKKIFPKIMEEWNKSDKTPETFIRLVEGGT
jgi:spermidine/putrescine-binding protein